MISDMGNTLYKMADNSKKPVVSIIIPLYNKIDLTRRCYDSIKTYTVNPEYEIIFVDNGSTDATGQFLKDLKGDVKSIINDKNLGFAKACNQGASEAAGKYILFLNNDVEVMENWLKPLVDILDNDPKVAAAAGKLLFPDRTIQHAGVIIIDDHKLPDPLVGRHIYYKHASDFAEANQRRTYQALTAACLLVRKSSFDAVKGFDEGYWNGYEDVDICFKFQEQNWLLVYEPESVVIHFESQSGVERFKKVQSNIERLHQKWLDKIIPDIVIYENGESKINNTNKIAAYKFLNKNIRNACDIKKTHPITSIIILAHNEVDYTRRCIESIYKNTNLPFELILVDNGSTDETWPYMESIFKSKGVDRIIKLIKNKENLGFAAGNNQGIAISSGEYILLLNNDTIVTEGWLDRMMVCAKAHPDSGIIGPMSNHVSGPQHVEKVNYNTFTGSGLNKFSRRFSAKYSGKAKKNLNIVGFCMLIKREVIRKIGGFDGRFGKGNFEDDDFSIRALLWGFESWIAKDCFIHHFGSKTFSGMKIDYRTSLEKNWEIFKIKWGLPDNLPLGSGYALPQRSVKASDPKLYYVPLPEVFNAMSTGCTQSNSYRTDQAYALSFYDKSLPYDNSKTLNTYGIRRIIDKAILMAHKGSADKSVKILLKAMKTKKGNKDVIYCLADILMNEKQYTQALNILDTIPDKDNNIRCMEIKASCEYALGHDSTAENIANRMIASEIGSPVAFFIKGKLAFKNCMYNEAKVYFLKVVEEDKAFGPAWSYLGLIENDNDSAAKALDLMEKGFSVSPVNRETLTVYYNEILSQKAFERAEKVFKNAINTHPNHKLINYRVTDLLLRQGKYEEAMQIIQKNIVTFGIDDRIIAAALSIKDKFPSYNTLDLAKEKGTLSVCMIVKNEENNIGKCLYNLKTLADEVIVVDTGSSDRTKLLADIYGAKVYDFDWKNDFSSARNYSISKATGSWILVVDADEIISPTDHTTLRQIININFDRKKAFSFITRNYQTLPNIIGMEANEGTYREETGYGWTPSEKVRLFRNNRPEIYYSYHVHELVEPSLKRINIKIEKCPVPVHHYGKLDFGADLKKGEKYYELGVKKLHHSPKDARALYELAIQAGGLKKWEEALELWKNHNEISPDDPVAYTNMGLLYQKLKKLDLAIAITEKAMKLAPCEPDPASNFALFQIYSGKAETAIPVLEMLGKKYPDYYSGRFKLAAACACKKNMGKASLILEELKKTALGQGLVRLCRNMVMELISFKQFEYARNVVNMMEIFMVGKSVENTATLMHSGEISPAGMNPDLLSL